MSENILQPFDYISGKIPYDYICSDCGLGGRKLWRQYNTFANHINLLCVDCTAKEEEKELVNMTEDGFRDGEYGRTDQIGMLIAAVPTEDGQTFWRYTSIPAPGVTWWREIPLRRKLNKNSLYDYAIICEIGSSHSIIEVITSVPLGLTTEEILKFAGKYNSDVKTLNGMDYLSVLRMPKPVTFKK